MRNLLIDFVLFICCACSKEYLGDGKLDASINTTSSLLTKSHQEKKEHANYSISFASAKTAAETAFSDGKKLVEFFPFVDQRDTLFYVANYDKGYKIISSDVRTSAILLESQEGKFTIEEQSTTRFSAPIFWMNNLSAEIHGLKNGYAESDNDRNIQFWNSMNQGIMPHLDSIDFDDPYHTWVKIQEYETFDTYYEDNVNHLIQTKWGQMSPWNTKVPIDATGQNPNCPTGCTAVALAQLLYFTNHDLGKPHWLYHDAQITGYSSGSNNYSFTYVPGTYTSHSTRWDDMALYFFEPSTYTDYVASLMADVGHVLGVIYTPERGSANLSVDNFNYYGIDCNYTSFDRSLIDNDLSNGRPVLITAYAGERRFLGIHISYYDGHAWLIDGKQTRVSETVKGYVWRRISDMDSIPSDLYLYTEDQARAMERDLYSGKHVTETYRSYSYFYRMNWGGDGVDDDVMYGTTWAIWNGIGYDFQYDKNIFYNIH